MYILVTNIPKAFRTPDLRNFFSEVIEGGIFNCFHFRHRPHRNFLTLFREWEVKKTNSRDEYKEIKGQKSLTSDNERVICACKSASEDRPINQKDTSDLAHGCESGVNNLYLRDTRLGGAKTRATNTESLDRRKFGDNSDVEETHKSSASACDCQKRKTIPEDYETSSDNDGRSNKDAHWLSSGLSGLTSLIKEKKNKASKEQSYVKRSSHSKDTYEYASKNQTDGNDEKTVKETNTTDLLESAEGTCCLVDIKENFPGKFKSLYHKKYWVDRLGDIQPTQCFVVELDVNLEDMDVGDGEKDYERRGSTNELQGSLTDVKNMIEFRPPSVMPQGNVGTPTVHFQNLIRSCQLPGTIITKLGLQFPRRRGKKRFGEVPFDYGTEIYSGDSDNREKWIAFTASGHLIPASIDLASAKKRPKRKPANSKPQLELQNEGEDGTEIEEWERYEAFHNDVTSQDRTKERLYEKEIELVWEKGGPGLVFYTDAQYWREQDGDFDEQTTDEWDVDMSVYYEKGAGDKDARDSFGMTQSNELRAGTLSQSVFGGAGKSKDGREGSGKRRKIGPSAPPKIGRFEAHTRGFGRRLMESQGWTDGIGLGRQGDGLPYALDNDGQHPRDKKGFGYHGEKLQGWGETSTARSRNHRRSVTETDSGSGIRISTVFDAPRHTDPPPPPLRTSEPTTLSHRHDRSGINFTKSSELNANENYRS